MTVDRRMQNLVTLLIIDKALEGYLLSNFDLDITKDDFGPRVNGKVMNTAALGYANGRFFIRFHEDFYNILSEKERLAVLRHEIGHFIHCHFARRGYRDPMIWNLACDMAINQFISDLPKDCCLPSKDMKPKELAEYYYDVLEKKAVKIKIFGQGNSGTCSKCGGQTGGGGQGQQKGKGQGGSTQGSGGGSGNTQGSGGGQGQKKCTCGSGGGDGDYTVVDNINDCKTDRDAAEAQAQAETMVKDTVAERLHAGDDPSKMRGLYGGALESLIKELTKKPIVDWRSALGRFISSFSLYEITRTLKKPDRRQLGPWGHRKEKLPKLIVAVDTSGSVSDKMLIRFFSQIRILGQMLSEVRVITCDAAVTGDVEYRPGMEKKLHAAGRGGTDYDPVVSLVNQKYSDYDGMVYLTDGYCPLPKERCKIRTLWVVEGNKEFPGKPIVFVEDQND